MKNTYEAIKVDDLMCFNKHKIDHDNYLKIFMLFL